jgi:hypothetical protein
MLATQTMRGNGLLKYPKHVLMCFQAVTNRNLGVHSFSHDTSVYGMCCGLVWHKLPHILEHLDQSNMTSGDE